MNNWRFALTWRWGRYLALAVVFAIVCVCLGFWQLARRDTALAELDRIDTNYSAEAVPLTGVLDSLDAFEIDQKWTPVTVTGTYLSDEELLVRNRPYNGGPGFEVLTPLRLENGDIFIVDRGWLPTGRDQDSPDEVPAAPTGLVTVEARLKPGEPTLRGRSAPEGQIATIQLDDIQKALDEPTYTGAYGLMVTEDPAPAERPVAAAKPARDEGPHLSYAFQWFVFAIFGFLGLGYALRQEYRLVNEDDPDEMERAEARRVKDAARTRTDAEVEDALIDAGR
ncbi:cytochrome oxidase assembly protein ShyY1 [Conyzicola lurida]|uniref:SURF1-like protein n=1 Tax=Conyzicola lurida TaxID=1172621 RepID=A0A841ALA1_9MICO|nr:SURF1 family protein [Conyzicola lurida]MBB5843128.1 cytochrome oxidase assembly protein ShyY1 [Conyzicola lurida]